MRPNFFTADPQAAADTGLIRRSESAILAPMRRFRQMFNPSYGQKIFLLATVPLVIAALAIAVLVENQSRQLAEEEINSLQEQLIEAKRQELKNYLSIVRTAFFNIYGRAAPDDEQAKLEVSRILSATLYGQDGYFFVFDYDGTNLVSPRQTFLINKNWRGLTDLEGVPITDELIRIARTGGGYHSFDWTKPSTRETKRMVAYVIGLQDWKWAVGTGIFIDDILDTVAMARADVEARINRTFIFILMITAAALIGVFLSGMMLNIRERRLADAKLKELTQRVFDTQEEERGRVARELHDGISQILVGIRYVLDDARRKLARGDEQNAQARLDSGIAHLADAINEIRRISRDLRPGVLDDLGLGPAIKALADEFGERTGIETDFNTVVFRNRLDQEAKIALYRIAQEALTNIERHSGASQVTINLRGHAHGATLRIVDNGSGLATGPDHTGAGLGLRNMQERVDQLDGTFRILSTRGAKGGTVIEVTLPLSHLLPPEKSAAHKFEANG